MLRGKVLELGCITLTIVYSGIQQKGNTMKIIYTDEFQGKSNDVHAHTCRDGKKALKEASPLGPNYDSMKNWDVFEANSIQEIEIYLDRMYDIEEIGDIHYAPCVKF